MILRQQVCYTIHFSLSQQGPKQLASLPLRSCFQKYSMPALLSVDSCRQDYLCKITDTARHLFGHDFSLRQDNKAYEVIRSLGLDLLHSEACTSMRH